MHRDNMLIFTAFVIVSLAITAWAARKASARSQFYAAGRSITGLQNGIAIAGEFLSAATFMGITGLYFTSGFDGLVYSVGALMGLPMLLFLLSDHLHRLGRYTLADVLSQGLHDRSMRVFSAFATVLVLLLYMVAQLVGAGSLIELLSGVSFGWSVTGIAVLMMAYVIFGGMVATTWVQIVKACFLVTIGFVLAYGVLNTFHFSPTELFRTAIGRHPLGRKIMGPSSLTTVGAAASAALTQVAGLAGLPHLIMRFFTVPNTSEARRSANYATAIIGGFYVLMIIIGYGAIAIVGKDSALLRHGNNMVPLALAHALGGDVLLGVCAGAIFATILAVVAGLTLAVAASISHDIYGTVIRQGRQSERQEIKVSRFAAVVFGAMGVVLSVVFRHENVTFLVVTSMSIAASSTFPALFLACFWRSLTATGAVYGGTIGLVFAICGIIVGPTVWVDVMGHSRSIFPYQYPTIVSLPVAFISIIAISIVGRRRAVAKCVM
jgi:cation/acetate symporter